MDLKVEFLKSAVGEKARKVARLLDSLEVLLYV